MCSRCATLQARVDDLESLLFSSKSDPDLRLCKALGVTANHARILQALYHAKEGLSHVELDAIVPLGARPQDAACRVDPEFRTLNTIKQYIHQIRVRLGPDFLRSDRWRGVKLSPKGRAAVKVALQGEDYG